MSTGLDDTPFVAIGGVGGSGTRVVAQIVRSAGFHLGPVVNGSMDNLLFTLLFKRPAWIASPPSEAEVLSTIDLYTNLLKTGLGPDNPTALDQIKALIGDFQAHDGKTGIRPERLPDLLDLPAPPADVVGLGWKEPNTHIYLPQLAQKLPNLKYIHLIRNGLDMALSTNQGQFRNWRNRFPEAGDFAGDETRNKLHFWLAANQRAIDFGQTQMPGRFLMLRYDDLCQNPAEHVARLLAFLGCTPPERRVDALINMVKPTTLNRFRDHPADLFTDQDRARVAALGFDTDPA